MERNKEEQREPTDMELYWEGLLKKEETWWFKKAIENAKKLRNFCEENNVRVHREFKDTDGWDSILFPAFILETKKGLYKVVCSESGPFIKQGPHTGCNFINIEGVKE